MPAWAEILVASLGPKLFAPMSSHRLAAAAHTALPCCLAALVHTKATPSRCPDLCPQGVPQCTVLPWPCVSAAPLCWPRRGRGRCLPERQRGAAGVPAGRPLDPLRHRQLRRGLREATQVRHLCPGHPLLEVKHSILLPPSLPLSIHALFSNPLTYIYTIITHSLTLSTPPLSLCLSSSFPPPPLHLLCRWINGVIDRR